jgi:hypothetical protein
LPYYPWDHGADSPVACSTPGHIFELMTPAGDRTCKVCLISPGFLADCRDSGTRQSYQDFILRTVTRRVRSQCRA